MIRRVTGHPEVRTRRIVTSRNFWIADNSRTIREFDGNQYPRQRPDDAEPGEADTC